MHLLGWKVLANPMSRGNWCWTLISSPSCPRRRIGSHPWKCNPEMYKRRNEIRAAMPSKKVLHRTLSRFEKVKCHVHDFRQLAVIVDRLRALV